MKQKPWHFIAAISWILSVTPAHALAADAPLISMDGSHITLRNGGIGAEWDVKDGKLAAISISDVYYEGHPLPIMNAEFAAKCYAISQPVFTLELSGRKRLKSSDMKVTAGPTVGPLPGLESGAMQVTVDLESSDVKVRWRILTRPGLSYFRELLDITATKGALPISRAILADWNLRFPYPAGTAQGVPLICGDLYMGIEHPSGENEVADGRAKCSLARAVPLEEGQTWKVSAVVGVTDVQASKFGNDFPPGQLRRDFQAYLERERPRPVKPFLHYNSWYDIGYFSNYTEGDVLNVINRFGEELSVKRGVKLDSFLFDDGWDDHGTLWGFNKDFPYGFKPVKEAAAKYGAAPGVWLSPWGGYGDPKEQRITNGKKAGYETNEGGFALSGPKYYERFRAVCLEFVEKYGVNQFKFDGTGNVSSRYPGSAFGTDFEAAIQLVTDLRAKKPDLYINLTTGTWPSPFWTRYADSIWRGGEDHSFAGVGLPRQQWITYRDGDVYHGIVSQSPLYPLNSLMLHGIIYAKHANKLNADPGHDFADEVHSYFATGTQCQEMYITPSLLEEKDWDTLAEAAKWARDNAATLKDSHWVGGDPTKGEVYGWAAWSPVKGIITLRNPSDQPAEYTLAVEKALEVPREAHSLSMTLTSVWDKSRPPTTTSADGWVKVSLKPFEVVTFAIAPASK